MLRKPAALLLLALALAACRGSERSSQTFPGAPVVIISIDTLRADHLPMFGYRGVETPHLDAFRRDSILFTRAYSHAPLTLPSHVSMLTGLLPSEHKVRNNIGYVLDEKTETLQQALQSQGYATGAAVSAFVLRGSSGLARGFDFYEDGIASRAGQAIGQLQRPGRSTTAIASKWISDRGSKPFFLMLHLFEPHSPYEPEPAFQRVASSYDGEIATADSIVGAFISDLKSKGLYDRAIILILSDHGEGLGDHGEAEHGIFVYREAIHVPLLLKLPASARAGEKIDRVVGLADIAPTVAQLVGVRFGQKANARSLLAPGEMSRRIYSETLYPRIHLGWSALRSLIDVKYHYIEAPRSELYDVQADPGERTNIADGERRVYAGMREAMSQFAAVLELPATIDPEEARKLAALGYLSSTPAATGGPLPDPKDRIGEIELMGKASRFLRERRYDEAIAAFRAIVAQSPRLADAWTQLGAALEGAGRYEEASAVYGTAIEVAPQLAGEFGLRRGAALLKLERFDEAAKHARLAERTNPAGMHVLLSRIELARKNFAEAEREARAALGDPTTRFAAELLLAQIYAQQSRLAEAQEIMNRLLAAMEGQPMVESFEYVRGDILARMERYEEAVEAFRREIAAFPHHRQTYANLYLVYTVTNRPSEARRVLEEMVAANPGRDSILFASRTAAAVGDERVAEFWRRRAGS